MVLEVIGIVVVTEDGSTDAIAWGTLDSTMPARPPGTVVMELAIDALAAEAAVAKVDALAAKDPRMCAGNWCNLL
jgi:hypothetical protein